MRIRREAHTRGREGSGFRVQGSGFRVQGSGFRVSGFGSRVSEARTIWAGRLGFRVDGLRFGRGVVASLDLLAQSRLFLLVHGRHRPAHLRTTTSQKCAAVPRRARI